MYHDVPSCRNLLPIAAHYFSNAPPHAIAHHGIAERFFDAESEARVRQFVWPKENREVGTGAAFPRAIHRIEIAASHQPRLAGKFRSLRRDACSGSRTYGIIRA